MSAPVEQMAIDPALGVSMFVLGGLAGAMFYLPFKKVERWAWESYWLVYAVFGLLVVPWALTLITSPNVFSVLRNTPATEIGYCYLCGAAWGLGGLTWGLMIRYLGVGLGVAIGCGLCSATGTLVPPIVARHVERLYGTFAANVALVGVLVSIAGIVLVGMAGMSKEAELPEEQKKKAVAEYDFKRGIFVAVFSGLLSSALNFGLQGGTTIETLGRTIAPVTAATWRGMPVLAVALLGGFTVNFVWCLVLNAKNRTFGDYCRSDAPLVLNIIFAGLAGGIWCSQFVCFKTGEPKMGDMAYVGWAVLMASVLMFSSLFGIFLGEWKGTSGRTRARLALGLLLLLCSAGIAGYSGYQAKQADGGKPSATAVQLK